LNLLNLITSLHIVKSAAQMHHFSCTYPNLWYCCTLL